MSFEPRRLLRSAPFRLALGYVTLFGVSSLVLLGFIYWSTVGYMVRQADATTQVEIAGLADHYRLTGLAGLKSLIERRLSRTPAGPSLYLLESSTGVRVAGNLAAWPQEQADDAGWVDFWLRPADSGALIRSRAMGFQLRGGYRLLVGRDMHELERFRIVTARTLGWGLAITVTLALFGGLLLSRGRIRHVGRINAAVDEIMSGDLSRRLPAQTGGDDFDQLTTNLNRMLDRIEQLMDDVRQVSQSIAHDLRTPLSRLRQRLELMQAAPDPEGVERAIAEADGLLHTFNALLRIARIESEARREAFAAVDLGKVVEHVAEFYAPVAEERGQQLEVAIVEGVRVRGDRDLLFQAMANLVDNALKHTSAGSRIELSLEERPGGARLAVADDGPGVPALEIPKVTRRFYRLDDARSTNGSGLGLSLVDAVARLHGATLTLTDNAPGLRVTLDLATG